MRIGDLLLRYTGRAIATMKRTRREFPGRKIARLGEILLARSLLHVKCAHRSAAVDNRSRGDKLFVLRIVLQSRIRSKQTIDQSLFLVLRLSRAL